MAIQKKKVLIVDDQESVLLIEERLAKFAGYDPITADNGEEALRLALTEPVRLILLDMMMPGMSGFEVLKALKDDPNTRDIPVIVITALDSIRDHSLKQLPGVVHILTKPVPARELQDVFKKYLGPPTEFSSS